MFYWKRGNINFYTVPNWIYPNFGISTQEAYAKIKPKKALKNWEKRLSKPLPTWKEAISNDFENSLFPSYPLLAEIKNELYTLGADYAAMSGSGSTIFGLFEKEIKLPNKEALQKGLLNLERHVNNLQQFGQTVVVALNRFHFDTEDELQMISGWCTERNAHYAENQGFAKGGEGAADLARKVVEIVEKYPSKPINHTYELTDSVADKLNKIVQKVYLGEGFGE